VTGRGIFPTIDLFHGRRQRSRSRSQSRKGRRRRPRRRSRRRLWGRSRRRLRRLWGRSRRRLIRLWGRRRIWMYSYYALGVSDRAHDIRFRFSLDHSQNANVCRFLTDDVIVLRCVLLGKVLGHDVVAQRSESTQWLAQAEAVHAAAFRSMAQRGQLASAHANI